MDQPSCCCQWSAGEVSIQKDEPAVTGSLGMSEPFSFSLSFSLTVSASFFLSIPKKEIALLGALVTSLYRCLYSIYNTGCHDYWYLALIRC